MAHAANVQQVRGGCRDAQKSQNVQLARGGCRWWCWRGITGSLRAWPGTPSICTLPPRWV